jgi:hypothetical protein
VFPASQVLPSTSPSAPVAPWHSTPSSFSEATPPVAPALPRIPPPTSVTYRSPRPSLASGQIEPSGNRSPRLELQHDPLGVL